MKLVLDEGVPQGLAEHLPGHDVQTVKQIGASGVKNGRLLKLVGSMGVDGFVTADKSLEKQNLLSRCPFGTLVLSTNSWPLIQQHLQAVAAEVGELKPQQVRHVDCGKFVPKRFRTPAP